MILTTDKHHLAMLVLVLIICIIVLVLRYITLVINPSLVVTNPIRVCSSVYIPILITGIILNSYSSTVMFVIMATVCILSFLVAHGLIKK